MLTHDHLDNSYKAFLLVFPFVVVLPFMVSNMTEPAAMAILSSHLVVSLSSTFNNVTVFIARLNIP
jgi:hypothetical protein